MHNVAEELPATRVNWLNCESGWWSCGVAVGSRSAAATARETRRQQRGLCCCKLPRYGLVRVRLHITIIGNARITNVGQYRPCMVFKLSIIGKQTVYETRPTLDI